MEELKMLQQLEWAERFFTSPRGFIKPNNVSCMVYSKPYIGGWLYKNGVTISKYALSFSTELGRFENYSYDYKGYYINLTQQYNLEGWHTSTKTELRGGSGSMVTVPRLSTSEVLKAAERAKEVVPKSIRDSVTNTLQNEQLYKINKNKFRTDDYLVSIVEETSSDGFKNSLNIYVSFIKGKNTRVSAYDKVKSVPKTKGTSTYEEMFENINKRVSKILSLSPLYPNPHTDKFDAEMKLFKEDIASSDA